MSGLVRLFSKTKKLTVKMIPGMRNAMFSSESQPNVGASVRYSNMRTMPAISIVAPVMSILLFSPGTSFLSITATTKNRIMLSIKAVWKAHCQLRFSTT